MQGDCFIKGIHSVCQDYAIVDGTRAFLSDGCSSSPRSEVGAHLIPELARQDEDFINYLKYLKNGARSPLEGICFDATYLSLTHDSDGNGFFAKTQVLGDGIIIARRRTGSIELTTIEYTDNAPYYVSYSMDDGKANLWEKQFPYNKKAVTSKIMGIEKHFWRLGNSIETDYFDYSKYESVFIASDGLKSFKDSGSQEIPLDRVIEEVMAVKNYNGQFLQRRLTKMIKDFAQQGIFATDDISIAGFYWGDEK